MSTFGKMQTLTLLMCMTLAVATSVNLEHLGKTIPLHIPTQTINSNATFEVPSWLGVYYATVEAPSTWTLPLTIGNGGQTYPGEFLYIYNNGPEQLTLYSQSPETIESASSYPILAGSVVGILSGYPNWIVVSASNGQSGLQNIYMFEGPDAGGAETAFTLEIGPWTYNSPPSDACDADCRGWNTISLGANAGQHNTGYQVNNLGQRAGQNNTGNSANNMGQNAGANNIGNAVNNLGRSTGRYNTGSSVNNIGESSGWYNAGDYVNNIGTTSGVNNTGDNVNNLGRSAGERNTGTDVNNMGRSAGSSNTAQHINNFGNNAGISNTGYSVNNIGYMAGASNTGSYCSHDGFQAGQTNTFDHCYTNGRGSLCTAANQFVFGRSANPLNLRLPSDTGSYCTGAAYDTCLNRGRAGAFTLDAGQDFYSTGFVCAGAGCTSAAPVAASTGLYDSNTRVVRSCTAGAGITCSVTDGVLTVSANANLQSENDSLRKRVEWLETQFKELLNKK